MNTDEELMRILNETKVIAVIGCSRDSEKAANQVPKYLKNNGYRIIPINPFADEILGERVYKSLSEIDHPVDLVLVFRPSHEVVELIEEAVTLKPKVVWMQLGIRNEKAAEIARKNGIDVVMDKCMMIEHKRLISAC